MIVNSHTLHATFQNDWTTAKKLWRSKIWGYDEILVGYVVLQRCSGFCRVSTGVAIQSDGHGSIPVSEYWGWKYTFMVMEFEMGYVVNQCWVQNVFFCSACGNWFLVSWIRFVNSLWPRDVIWWHRYESTLAPSHYLNQCWLIISDLVVFTGGQHHWKYARYLSLMWVGKSLI